MTKDELIALAERLDRVGVGYAGQSVMPLYCSEAGQRQVQSNAAYAANCLTIAERLRARAENADDA